MKGYAIKGQPFKISINRLWVISNCLIMAAFFSLNSFFSQSSYKKVLEQQFKVKQYQMLVYISDTLEQSMQSIELLSRSTVNNYSIINNILNYKKNKNSYEQMVFQNNMNQNLSSVAYSLGDIISVNILLDDEGLKTTKINGVYDYGHYVTGSGLDGIRDLSEGWVPTRKNDLPIQPYIPYITSYVQRIYSGMYYGDAIGHLVINLNEDMFYKQMESYRQEEGSDILLVDGNGTVLSGTVRDILGMDLSGTEYGAYGELSSGHTELTVKDGHKIVSKRKLQGRDLYVLAITDYDRVVAPIRQTQNVVLFCSLLFMALFSVISGLLAYKISKPILSLSREVMNCKGGQFRRIHISSRIYEIDVLCTQFNHMTEEIDKLIGSVLKQEKLKQKKELEILQAQINPHFLYNTLESITWMVEANKNEEAVFMISELAKLLRISLSKGRTVIRIADELQHSTSYMNIQKVRYKDRFETEFLIEEEIKEYCTIKLIIQPILENAIYYGVGNMDEDDGGKITVKGKKDGNDIYISVIDNGMGMSEEIVENLLLDNGKVPKHGSGVGLINVHTRIQLMYGKEYGLKIYSEPDEGTEVVIHIPAIPFSEENRKKLEEQTYRKGEAYDEKK